MEWRIDWLQKKLRCVKLEIFIRYIPWAFLWTTFRKTKKKSKFHAKIISLEIVKWYAVGILRFILEQFCIFAIWANMSISNKATLFYFIFFFSQNSSLNYTFEALIGRCIFLLLKMKILSFTVISFLPESLYLSRVPVILKRSLCKDLCLTIR